MESTSVCINSDSAQLAYDKSLALEQKIKDTLSKAQALKSQLESAGMSGEAYEVMTSIMSLIVQYHEALANHFPSHNHALYWLLQSINDFDYNHEISSLRSL